MADPLSISSGIVGVVVPALHGARLLLRDVERIIDAPETLKRLGEEVNATSACLGLLKDIEEPVWTSLGTEICDQSRDTVKTCETAFDTIRGDIQRWTRRSKGGSLSWPDRVKVGFFMDHQLKAHFERLQTYRLRFTSVVGMATLYSSIHNFQLTDELCKSVKSQQGCNVVAEGSTDAELAVVQQSLTELQLAPTAEPSVYNKPAETGKSIETGTGSSFTFGENDRGLQIGISYGSVNWNSGG